MENKTNSLLKRLTDPEGDRIYPPDLVEEVQRLVSENDEKGFRALRKAYIKHLGTVGKYGDNEVESMGKNDLCLASGIADVKEREGGDIEVIYKRLIHDSLFSSVESVMPGLGALLRERSGVEPMKEDSTMRYESFYTKVFGRETW